MNRITERLDNMFMLLTMHNLGSDKDYSQIKQDLETLEMLLSCFKSAILDATSPLYRRGDNIVADLLRDELGLIKLNELKRRLENVN